MPSSGCRTVPLATLPRQPGQLAHHSLEDKESRVELTRMQIYFRNQTTAPGDEKPVPGNLPLATVLSIVVDSFTSATEREIKVGDDLEVFVVMNAGRTTDDLVGEGKLPSGMSVEELMPLGEGGGERTFLVKRALKRD